MAGAKEHVAGTKSWTKHGSGFLWDMSEEQRENLATFLARVPKEVIDGVRFSHETHESFGARFLRARKYDVDAAVEMVNNSYRWRQEKNPKRIVAMTPEEIVGCPVAELSAFYPNRYLPIFDTQGRPVYLEMTGKLDIEGLLCSTTSERMIDWHIACLEGFNSWRMDVSSKARADGRIVEGTMNILDLDGMSMSQFGAATRQYLSDISKVDQDNYPETLGHMILINTPTVFSMIWSVIKGFLDERTQSKIEVVGSDYTDRLAELLGGLDNVPVEYGGRLRLRGGIHSTYMQATHLGSGKKVSHTLELNAGETGRVRWIARPADIEFSVTWIPAGGGAAVDVYPLAPHPTSNTTFIHFVHEAKTAGKLVATWDNSKGWKERLVNWGFVALRGAEELRAVTETGVLDLTDYDPCGLGEWRFKGHKRPGAGTEGEAASGGGAAGGGGGGGGGGGDGAAAGGGGGGGDAGSP